MSDTIILLSDRDKIVNALVCISGTRANWDRKPSSENIDNAYDEYSNYQNPEDPIRVIYTRTIV